MNRKPAASRLPRQKVRSGPMRSWHNGGDIEIHRYARSLQKAAKTLIGRLERNQSASADWDVCPVVLLYRESLELHLKLLVGEGSNFLPSPTDPITLFKTHSLRWLAQIVCQIIKVVEWEKEFTCDGVGSLAEFSALVGDVESFDPVARAIQSARTGGPDSASKYYRNFNIIQFAKKLDALLNLLDVTADALSANWDQQAAIAEFEGVDDIRTTIQ